MRATRRRIELLGALFALGGCALGTSPQTTPSGTSPGTASPGASSAPAPTPPVGVPTSALTPTSSVSRSCFDRVLGAKTVSLKGVRGSVRWNLSIPEFSGAPSAGAINRHVRASAQDAIDLGLREGRDDRGVGREIAGIGAVTTSDRRTVQVELTWIDNLVGTAHPTEYVATTVVTTDEGRPVRLREVLADEPSALRTIAEAIRPMAEPTDTSGLAPKEKNFAAWQTTRDGMRFDFQDYQLGGHGRRSYTVPWATVRPLLSAYGTGLLDPDVDPTTC